MILVIADDFTGAAEIAAITKEFGLSTEIQTTFLMNSDADVIIVDTNTRVKPAEEAVIILKKLLESIKQYEFDFIYKKTDSVLRGHIYEELSVLLEFYPEKSILLVPSNPTKDRIISNKTYFFDGKPVHESFFFGKEELPSLKSDIFSLIKGGKKDKFKVLEAYQKISKDRGMIYIGEAKNKKEINYWVQEIEGQFISAGAADFFKAILKAKKHPVDISIDKIDLDKRNALFVCGSRLSRPNNIKKELISNNPHLVELSQNQLCLNNNPGISEIITKNLIDQFTYSNIVILFVTQTESISDLQTKNIPKVLAEITSAVIGKIQLDELFIEGGTTSSEIVRKNGWTHFKPVNYIGSGLARMQVIDSPSNYITVKPGSYSWPDNLWQK